MNPAPRLLTAVVLALTGCGSSDPTVPNEPVSTATEIRVTAPTNTVISTGTVQLQAAILPSSVNQTVTWASGAPDTASVSSEGLVTGLLHGRVTVTATSTANPSIRGTIEITVGGCPTPRAMAITIGADATLANWVPEPTCFDYVAESAVTVNGALLTLEPGVALGFDAGYLLITPTGGLDAPGTAEEPIRIAGTTAERGNWDGILLQGTTHPSNRLVHVTVEHGGGRVFGGMGPANLIMELGATTRAAFLTLRESAGHGLYMVQGTSIIDGYQGGALTQNTSGPAFAATSQAHLLGGGPTLPSMTGNDRDVFDLVGNTVPGTVTWHDLGVPYRLLNDNSGESFNITGTMTLMGSATVEFDEDTAMNVSGGGSLYVMGTADAPVRLTGTTKVRGFWRGLRLQDGEHHLEGLVVEYGGRVGGTASYQPANLQIRTSGNPQVTRLTLRNSILRESGNYGISSTMVGSEMVAFQDNILTGNTLSATYLPVTHVDRLVEGNLFTGNDDHRLRIHFADYIDGASLSTGSRWRSLGLPYHVVPGAPGPTLIVAGSSLTIDPGVEIEFDEGVGIAVIDGGTLSAIGTEQNRIKLRGADVQWRGINIFRSSAAFDYLDFADAGSMGWSVEAQPASVTVTSTDQVPSIAMFSPNVTTSGAPFGVAFGYGLTYGRPCLPPIFIPWGDEVSDHCQPG